MKKFETYRHIRKQAYIMGLPMLYFALMMMIVIGTMLYIIFSFSLTGVILSLVLNVVLYVLFLKLTQKSGGVHFKKVYPDSLINKKSSHFQYEEN